MCALSNIRCLRSRFPNIDNNPEIILDIFIVLLITCVKWNKVSAILSFPGSAFIHNFFMKKTIGPPSPETLDQFIYLTGSYKVKY